MRKLKTQPLCFTVMENTQKLRSACTYVIFQQIRVSINLQIRHNLTYSIHLGAITVSGVPEAVHNVNPDIEPLLFNFESVWYFYHSQCHNGTISHIPYIFVLSQSVGYQRPFTISIPTNIIEHFCPSAGARLYLQYERSRLEWS